MKHITLKYFFLDVNSVSRDFDNGTALHIACANLCTQAVIVLLENSASPSLRDDLERTPKGKRWYFVSV